MSMQLSKSWDGVSKKANECFREFMESKSTDKRNELVEMLIPFVNHRVKSMAKTFPIVGQNKDDFSQDVLLRMIYRFDALAKKNVDDEYDVFLDISNLTRLWVHNCVKLCQRQGNRFTTFTDYEAMEQESINNLEDGNSSLDELLDEIYKCCKDKRDKQIVDHLLDDYSITLHDIAEKLGCTSPTVYRRQKAIEGRFNGKQTTNH